jgi:hypothetical protein
MTNLLDLRLTAIGTVANDAKCFSAHATAILLAQGLIVDQTLRFQSVKSLSVPWSNTHHTLF